MEALQHLKSTEPPQWIVPSETLSQKTRVASQHLFSLIKPHAQKSPFDKLLVDGFDAEQIWQQIDIQSQPLLSGLKRQVKHWEKHPEDLELLKESLNLGKKVTGDKVPKQVYGDDDDDHMNELDDDDEMDELDDDEEEDKDMDDEKEASKERESEEGDSGDEDDEEGGEEKKGVIEDRFLKINELEEYLEEDEAREYGLDTNKKKKKNNNNNKKLQEEDDEDDDEDDDDNEDEEDDVDDNEDEEDDELGMFDDEDEEANKLESARYDDFFGKKKKESKRKSKLTDGVEGDFGSSDEDEMDDVGKSKLSTHEKQVQKLRAEIEQMERAALEPKAWTMQGEVTAASRPKNSALEVDLDFEHNARPAPVITEEVTTSIEDMIKNRINEGLFDDVQKVSALPTKGPREVKELDENKSKKGLAEVYEDEYVQNTNPAAAPTSFSDEQKKEASTLFKKLCLKLDALSHFNFAPKPVIEDMSIQTNVPALAMEEIAPMAVSDAAMLAPEEVFSGKGDIKEEAELTQAERKRRRAKKKRKAKAENAKRMAEKPRDNTSNNDNDGKGE